MLPWLMVTRWVIFTRWVTVPFGLIIPNGTMIHDARWVPWCLESWAKGVGRADAEGPAVTEGSRTIFYFFKLFNNQ